jgi:hypothetical protein
MRAVGSGAQAERSSVQSSLLLHGLLHGISPISIEMVPDSIFDRTRRRPESALPGKKRRQPSGDYRLF